MFGYNNRMFACEVCSKRFCTRKDVKRHMVVHTGRRDFACRHCPRRFGRKDHLLRHVRNSHVLPRSPAVAELPTPGSSGMATSGHHVPFCTFQVCQPDGVTMTSYVPCVHQRPSFVLPRSAIQVPQAEYGHQQRAQPPLRQQYMYESDAPPHIISADSMPELGALLGEPTGPAAATSMHRTSHQPAGAVASSSHVLSSPYGEPRGTHNVSTQTDMSAGGAVPGHNTLTFYTQWATDSVSVSTLGASRAAAPPLHHDQQSLRQFPHVPGTYNTE